MRRALASGGPAAAERALADLVDRFGADRVSIELSRHGHPDEDERNAHLAALASRFGVGVIATTAAHFATPQRRRLAMAMAAVRARKSLDDVAGWLDPVGGAHLRSGDEMARLFSHCPEVVTAAAELGEACAFDLKLIAPELPPFDVEDGHTEASFLRKLAIEGAARRYGPRAGAEEAYVQIEKELNIITRKGFPGYFLVVYDIARFCRANDILCQGRGSAVNSAVCYALGVTSIDPVAEGLLFERFMSKRVTVNPISISTSNPTAEKKSSSTSIPNMAETRLLRSPIPSPTAAGWRCATWPRRWGSRKGSRMRGVNRWGTGVVWPMPPQWTAFRPK